MQSAKRQRFVDANSELRVFLRQAEGVASGWTDTVNANELWSIWCRLIELVPELNEHCGCESVDAEFQKEIAEYVKNLKVLQQAAETIRCAMLARRAKLEDARVHLDGLHGWMHAYRQTI